MKMSEELIETVTEIQSQPSFIRFHENTNGMKLSETCLHHDRKRSKVEREKYNVLVLGNKFQNFHEILLFLISSSDIPNSRSINNSNPFCIFRRSTWNQIWFRRLGRWLPTFNTFVLLFIGFLSNCWLAFYSFLIKLKRLISNDMHLPVHQYMWTKLWWEFRNGLRLDIYSQTGDS